LGLWFENAEEETGIIVLDVKNLMHSNNAGMHIRKTK
jgi:hypothetical protein